MVKRRQRRQPSFIGRLTNGRAPIDTAIAVATVAGKNVPIEIADDGTFVIQPLDLADGTYIAGITADTPRPASRRPTPISSLLTPPSRQSCHRHNVVDGTAALLTWPATPPAGFRWAIWRSDTPDGLGTVLGETTAGTFTDTTAEPGRTYYYTAVGLDSAERFSRPSTPARLTTVDGNTNRAPVAAPQSVIVTGGTSRAITLTGTDPDGTPLTFTIEQDPAHGTLTGTAPNLTYTPEADYTGLDELQFSVSDGESSSSPATRSPSPSSLRTGPRPPCWRHGYGDIRRGAGRLRPRQHSCDLLGGGSAGARSVVGRRPGPDLHTERRVRGRGRIPCSPCQTASLSLRRRCRLPQHLANRPRPSGRYGIGGRQRAAFARSRRPGVLSNDSDPDDDALHGEGRGRSRLRDARPARRWFVHLHARRRLRRHRHVHLPVSRPVDCDVVAGDCHDFGRAAGEQAAGRRVHVDGDGRHAVEHRLRRGGLD